MNESNGQAERSSHKTAKSAKAISGNEDRKPISEEAADMDISPYAAWVEIERSGLLGCGCRRPPDYLDFEDVLRRAIYAALSAKS